MVVALVLFVVSLVIRAGNPTDRTIAFALLVIGYLVISLGAAVGGDLVFLIGTHVNRHAWRGAGTKWVAVDLGGLPDIPEGGPTKVKAGINDLVVIRNGDTILALHAQCAHAGRPARRGHARQRPDRVPVARLAVPPRQRPCRPRPGDVRPAGLRGSAGPDAGWEARRAAALT